MPARLKQQFDTDLVPYFPYIAFIQCLVVAEQKQSKAKQAWHFKSLILHLLPYSFAKSAKFVFS